MSGLAAAGDWARGAVWRIAAFLGLWLILSGTDPADLPVGIGAAVVAAWTSLRLLPLCGARPSPAALSLLALRFLYQSIVAGADVARRALDPRLPLRPGCVTYPIRFPPGAARNVFTTLTMAAQLIGTGGIAALLLLGAVTGVPAAIDVALTLALLATFASIAFVKKGSSRLEADGSELADGG